MPAEPAAAEGGRARTTALRNIAVSASSNIPGVDFASITVRDPDQSLHTLVATDPLAEKIDALQYELHEGPCYAAVTADRLVLINDAGRSPEFPNYGPRAAELGVRSQAALQLIDDRERAGLNLYAFRAGAFDRSTLQLAELYATQTAALLDYAEQVDQLSVALQTRTDIGTAVGIVMERYGIDRHKAFGFLVRSSNNHNVKLRVLAQRLIEGTFEGTHVEDSSPGEWP